MNPDELRALDGEIALLVYGWKFEHVGPDYYGKNECDILAPPGGIPPKVDLPRKGLVHPAYLVPSYTGNLHFAITLANDVGLRFENDIPTDPAVIAKAALDLWKERNTPIDPNAPIMTASDMGEAIGEAMQAHFKKRKTQE